MSQASSTTAKIKCAQLQIPNERAGSSTANSSSQNRLATNASKCFRSLFEDNLDRLKEYMALTKHFKCSARSFSTSDITGQTGGNCNFAECVSPKKYHSECDLASYSKLHSIKEIGNDYTTYSCSTLAICGDTLHSSQLPSPQTQSIRQINSFIFSDLDLILSFSKKIRNLCLHQRMAEFVKSANVGDMQRDELEAITKLSPSSMSRPFHWQLDLERGRHFATDTGDILIHVIDYETEKEKANGVTKRDKEMFVLNWLQTLEAYPQEQKTND